MNSILHRVAPIVTTLGLLVMPLSVHAVTPTAPVKYSQARLNSATGEVQRALKKAGVPSIQAATPKQLGAAIVAVIMSHKGDRNFILVLTAALVQFEPGLSGEITGLVVSAVTPPGGVPPAGLVAAINGEAAAAQTAANSFSGAPSGRSIVNPNDAATSSNSSAGTVNPANISGSGSATPVPTVNSPTTVTGG